MRKLVVFLLAFAAGLGFLLWRQSRMAPPPAPPAPTEPETRPFTEVEVKQGEDGKGQAVGVLLDGPLDFAERVQVDGEPRRALVLRSSDVDSLEGGSYLLKDLAVDLYDPQVGLVRATLRAPRATVVLAVVDGVPALAPSNPVELEQPSAVILRGSPVTPLKVESSRLSWLPGEDLYRTDEAVVATGAGLRGSGIGFEARGQGATIELKRAVSIAFELEDGGVATLSSGATAGVVLRSVERDGGELLQLVASGGARLVLAGGRAIAIEGETITIVGRPGDEDRPFQLLSAVAERGVVAEHLGDTLRADRAEFAFRPDNGLSRGELVGSVELESRGDKLRSEIAVFEFSEAGLLARAEFSGSPRGELALGRVGDAAEARGERAVLDGLGPLVVSRGAEDRMTIAGPASLELRQSGIVLKARESLSAQAALDGASGRLEAIGEVRLVRGADELAGERVELDYRAAPGGARLFAYRSLGSTRLAATTRSGAPFRATASSGVRGRLEGARFLVDEARDVRIEHGAAAEFVAEARLVEDFDAAGASFRASGDVRIAAPQGSGFAQEARVAGQDRVELFGTPEAPARWSNAANDARGGWRATAQALSIAADPRRLEAKGAVVARVEAEGAELDLSSGSFVVELGAEAPTRPVVVVAESSVHAVLVQAGDKVVLDGEYLRADGELSLVREEATRPDGTRAVVEREVASGVEVLARTKVRVSWLGDAAFSGEGDRFWMHKDGRMRLDAAPGERLSVAGRLAGTALDYDATATWLERSTAPASLELAAPLLLLRDGPPRRADATVLRKLQAGRLKVDSTSILLEGAVASGAPGQPEWEAGSTRLEGWDEEGREWRVQAGSIRLRGDFRDARRLEAEDIQSLVAQGGFRADFGDSLSATGDRLDGVPGRLRFEGRPALMRLEDSEWESEWIQYDLVNLLLSTDAGELRSKTGATGMSWALRYDSLQPFDQQDSTILALRNPRMRAGQRQVRADWVLFWLDRERWRRGGLRAIKSGMGAPDLRSRELSGAGEPLEPRGAQGARVPADEMMREQLAGLPLGDALAEVYIEGNIEYYDAGERQARAAAVYLDLVEQHGWIQQGDLSIELNLRERPERLRVKADWLRISNTPAGAELRAASAILSSCEYDDPHYVIETGDLRFVPRQESKDERVAYSVAARDNAIRFQNGFKLPLPSIVFETDERGNPLVDRLVLGNSARLGTQIRASINADLGSLGLGFGKIFAGLIGLPSTDIRGGWNYDVGLLGSRGVLLGAELDLQIARRFRLKTSIDAIPDDGRDRGFVRVDPDDRDTLRTWLVARGRYDLGPGEWIDIVGSLQSDPGVQAEFFENDYLAYEQKDVYLHWRKAREEWYASAIAKFVVEDRTDTEELPSAFLYLPRKRVGGVAGADAYWTGTATAANLRRLEGDPTYYPYTTPYPDGLGEREVVRASVDQRIELPFDVGVAAVRATPYIQGSARIWDQAVDPEDSASRAALIGGLEFSSTFWRRSAGGAVQTITPSLAVAGAFASWESEAEPVYFDPIEAPLDGELVEAGLRTRWSSPMSRERFDADLRLQRRMLPDESDTRPAKVLGEYLTWLGQVPVGLRHDGRYELDGASSPYARTALGFEPTPSLGLEFGHVHGRSEAGDPLFEAVTGALRWRWTTKWELQFQQSLSLLEDASLGNQILLRRLDHDFVTEIEVSYRAGEGASFSLNLLPKLSWRRQGLGLLDNWLGLYH
jgi:hypothetical protein